MARILVIDDEPAVCSLFRTALECGGHTVDEAHDGDDGLAAYARQPADLVIVDLVMPRVNGMTVIERLRRSDPDVRIIPMTGALASLCTPENLMQALGGRRVLVKPLTPDEILRAVFEVLGQYRRAEGLNTWHWCEACSRWPTASYFEWQGKPPAGDFCLECRERDKHRGSTVLTGLP